MYEKLISACKHYDKTANMAEVMQFLPNNVLQGSQKEKLIATKFILFLYDNQLLTPEIYDDLSQDSITADLYSEFLNACHLLDDANILCAFYVHSLIISLYPEELSTIIVIMKNKDADPAEFTPQLLAPSDKSVTINHYVDAFRQLELMFWLKKPMIEQIMKLSSPKEFTRRLSILHMANQFMLNPHLKSSLWMYELFANTPAPEKLAAGLIALLKLNPKLFNQFNGQIFAYRLIEYSAVGVLLEILSGLPAANSTTSSSIGYLSQNVFDLIVQCDNYEWLISAAALKAIWPAILATEIDAALPALFILGLQSDSLARAERLIQAGGLISAAKPADTISVSNHVLQLNRNPLAQNGFFARAVDDYSSDEDNSPATKKAKYKESI